MNRYVVPGSTSIQDCWRGFEHLRVNHSQYFVDPNIWANTQNIKSNW